jgi:hypothetical protein
MDFVERSKEGEESSEKALGARLRQFVEDSDLSFMKSRRALEQLLGF